MTESRAMTKLGRRSAMLLSAGLLSGCSLFEGSTKKPVPGVKIPVLPPHQPLVANPAAPPVRLPPSAALNAWTQAGANARHNPGSVSLPARLAQAWRTGIGAGGTYRRSLHTQPVVANGRVFTMDANGFVDAVALETGRHLWRQKMRPRHNTSFAFGGGLAIDGGILYVATGFAELRALDPATGAAHWMKKLDQPARSAPAIGGGQIYIVLLDNTLTALDAKTGDFAWRFPTGSSSNSMFGAGAPAYDQGVVVAGFGTGLLAGINATTGSALWEQSLAAGYDVTNPLNVSSIVANPVIGGNLVVATGLAGSTVAFDLRSGRRIWGHGAGGAETPAIAGDWLFLLTDDQRLAAIHMQEGYTAWVTALPAWRNPKTDSGPISWHGPLLAGNGLILTGSDRRMIVVDARTGVLLTPPDRALGLNGVADMAPIAAGGNLLVLTRNAVLTAYR
ncbi:PQQ-binding-like beta-propeller repeat protein [Acidiphilium sp. AL]|uniref:PQQ-binding-like beta-propeller repeat protein n=1 Tax=Acidiphilium iwatense TaxID=768198 RepID=A0ABS9DW96_9PROT|nr:MULTISPECIES: PQQ-binding-like beta-propeller repeat protein [Acidiphilium]MCF3946959.1 PQQ-binding-like beta-propeller repeat protein [Acidiphilium iwatense]MCU4160365.1 PQQ-binding-like beta-propeller repeat protein [Acidiphilium sp. AL]